MGMTISERIAILKWRYPVFPLWHAWLRLRGWLTEADSIEQMIKQGKIHVDVLKGDPTVRRYVMKMPLTRREEITLDEARAGLR